MTNENKTSPWTESDELEFQMGDMHGVAFKSTDGRTNQEIKKAHTKPSKPILITKKTEKEKKHITKNGK